jgi:hypothetical protein
VADRSSQGRGVVGRKAEVLRFSVRFKLLESVLLGRRESVAAEQQAQWRLGHGGDLQQNCRCSRGIARLLAVILALEARLEFLHFPCKLIYAAAGETWNFSA